VSSAGININLHGIPVIREAGSSPESYGIAFDFLFEYPQVEEAVFSCEFAKEEL
jgi:hypothetical protein